MLRILSLILCMSFSVSTFANDITDSAPITSAPITESQLCNFALSMGLSTVTGLTAGALFGYLNKVIDQAADKHQEKILGRIGTWILAPAARVVLLNSIKEQAKNFNIPFNPVMAQILARIVDWLVYFDKIPSLNQSVNVSAEPISQTASAQANTAKPLENI